MTDVTHRPCGECNACCGGQLLGTAHGNSFGSGKKCIFLVEQKCSIYDTRPGVCRKYQCAWSQHLLDAEDRPDQLGLMVSVENQENKQVLRAIELWETVPYSSYEKLNQAAKRLNTTWTRVPYKK
jgi:Fe-S-cluster containining protein